MLSLFEDQRTVFDQLSGSDRFTHLCSVLRSLYQTTALAAVEIVYEMTPDPTNNIALAALVARFDKPSDGLPVEVLELVTPIIRSQVQRDYHMGWFERDPVYGDTVTTAATAWIGFRNKKPGHGVLSKADINDWTPRLERLLQRSLKCFGNTLPRVDKDENLKLAIGGADLTLRTPLLWGGRTIVVSGVAPRKSIWKFQGQPLDWQSSDGFSVDLPSGSVFEEFESGTGVRFTCVDVEHQGKPFSIFSNLPVRQTSTFEGRISELDKLRTWMNEPQDQTLLIFGDGGFGKTTLALEYLNRVCEGQEMLTVQPPSIISYYSAKMTRWTDQGLEHLQGISGAMEECVRELLFFLYDVLDKDFYKLDRTRLIDRAAAEFAAQGFKRDDILLVVDNTETLANSPEETEELAAFLKHVSRKLGRVLLTSRRRELTAFEPLQVGTLSDAECVALMRRVADEHNAVAIKQAGENTLRKLAKKLSYKPLLVDILVKYLARTTVGIDEAVEQVIGRSDDQLAEFLYEDAWQRINELQRDVFLVLVSAAVPLDDKCVADACVLVEIPHVEFQKAFGETYFALVTDYGDRYEVQFVELAKRFFAEKLSRRNSLDQDRLRSIARRVDTEANKRQQADLNFRTDRVADAFRSTYAKAAKIATERGDYGGAEDNFRLALLEEPMNAALHDRFAWFLLHWRQQAEMARPIAERAVELDPHNADASLTLALCWYWLDNLARGDAQIKAAQEKGKAPALCLLRIGIARYHAAKKAGNTLPGAKLLADGKGYIAQALRALDPEDIFMAKNLREARRYEKRLLDLEYWFNLKGIQAQII